MSKFLGTAGRGKSLLAALHVVVLCCACNKPWRPVDEIPSPPEERIGEYQRILSGGSEAGKYWHGFYTPDDSYGTFSILLHFRQRTVSIYSDDVTYVKERDVGVLYDIEEGLISDKLTFSTYCLFHEMRENRKGEFEFYIREEETDAHDDTKASRLVLESLSDGFADLTTFSIEALNPNDVATHTAQIKALRDVMERVEQMEKSRANAIYSEVLGADIPLNLSTSRRVITFLSEAKDTGLYEEMAYPFRPLVGDDGVARLRFLLDEDREAPAIVAGAETHHLGTILEMHEVETEKLQDTCVKTLHTARITFPERANHLDEFFMGNRSSVGEAAEEVERLLRTGIRLSEGELVYGGSGSGLEGGLESVSFDVTVNVQIQWHSWRNCGSVIIIDIPDSPVSLVRDIAVRQIDEDYISFKESPIPEGRSWRSHINRDLLTFLESTEEEEYEKFPVPQLTRFLNDENGLKYAFHMITGEGNKFFVEVDKDLAKITFTSLCHDFEMTFDYNVSESSCYNNYP